MASVLLLAAICAVVLTAIDSTLMQLQRHFLTGGFLAAEFLRSNAQAALFFGASLILDSAWSLAAVAMLLPLIRRLRLGHAQQLALLAVAALAGPLVVDIMRYELQRHLGDLVDLHTLIAIAGGWPAEMLAQSSSHLLPLALALALALLAVGAVIVWLRRWPQGTFFALPGAGAALGAAAGALLLALGVASATCSQEGPICAGLGQKPSGMAVLWLAERLSDWDRDGYGLLTRPRDPAPLDASIHPYALDLPGNGIDENGLAGDLPADVLVEDPPAVASGWSRRPSVLIVMLESFRADIVGAKLGGLPVTPFLDQLSREGAAASHAYATTPFTARSRPQFFTGAVVPMPGDSNLLDDFGANGYFVAYFSGQDESFGGNSALLGLPGKADHFYDARQDRDGRTSRFSTPGSLAVSWRVLNDRVLAFLSEHEPRAPLFLYVNYHDTHFPYHHHDIENLLRIDPLPRAKIRPAAHERLWQTYANTAANVDRAIGELVGAFRAAIGGAEHVILVTADHGEALFEDGYLGHGQELTDVHARVPLILWGPAGEWPEPLALPEVRGLLSASLGSAPEAAQPGFVADADRRLFHYVPNIDRPRFIGQRGLGFEEFYDMKRQQLRGRGEPPAAPELLAPLVHRWEAERLAAQRRLREHEARARAADGTPVRQ
jgi:hypothetical protein